MPSNTVYIGRPSKWGNEFILGTDGITRTEITEKFRRFQYLSASPVGRSWVKQALKGKDLACWCPLDQPCHADVLLESANS